MQGKSFHKHRFLLAVIFLYVIVGGIIINYQYNYITNYQYVTLGENALNLSELVAKTLHVTNADVEELENITFEEMLEHPLNNRIKELFHLIEENNSIKYAYVLRALPEEKIKYAVDEEDSEFYGLPAGTKLDYVWLLDVIVDVKQQAVVAAAEDYYKDKSRYTSVDEETAEILKNREARYMLFEGEWGTEISGLAPLYTEEGDYIGLFGVDMYPESFFRYRASIFWALLALIMIPTIFTTGIYIFMHLSYRKKMNVLAYKDQLTNVYNRRYFDTEGNKIFQEALKNNTAVGVILGDIDDFKYFNDKYGHQEGDTALQLVAKVMESFLNKDIGFVARYGGEEFVIVVDNPKDLAAMCQSICNAISEKNVEHLDGSQTHVTISLGGYSKIPENGENIEKFVKNADVAMYQAKKAGKNTFFIID